MFKATDTCSFRMNLPEKLIIQTQKAKIKLQTINDKIKIGD